MLNELFDRLEIVFGDVFDPITWQQKAADAAGVSLSYFDGLIAGEHPVTVNLLARWANASGYTAHWLLTGEGPYSLPSSKEKQQALQEGIRSLVKAGDAGKERLSAIRTLLYLDDELTSLSDEGFRELARRMYENGKTGVGFHGSEQFLRAFGQAIAKQLKLRGMPKTLLDRAN